MRGALDDVRGRAVTTAGATLSALAAAALLVLAVRAQTSSVEIVFASGPDDTGTVQRLIDGFNEAHAGEIRVVWREMDRESDAHRRALLEDLAATPGGIDLMATDVVWTAELAATGHVEELTDRFYDAYDRDAFLSAPLQSATYRLAIRGIPWYTDAGLLYYRRDLLAGSGVAGPPATWDELARTARRVMADADVPYGFVFQGAPYEGGTANAAEFIWSAGGDLMTSRIAVTGLVMHTVTEVDSVSVGTAAAARGLDIARGLVAEGIAPPAVTGFREREALEAFAAGEAVFMRNWPYAWAVLEREDLTPDQIGVAALPAADTSGGRQASALGGWNLMINAASSDREKDAAWTLIRHLTDPAQQRRQAVEAGLLPVLAALYDDAELVAEVPVMEVGARVFESHLRARPMSPFYGDVSAAVAGAFQRVLGGALTGPEAVRLLEEELRAIVVRNR